MVFINISMSIKSFDQCIRLLQRDPEPDKKRTKRSAYPKTELTSD